VGNSWTLQSKQILRPFKFRSEHFFLCSGILIIIPVLIFLQWKAHILVVLLILKKNKEKNPKNMIQWVR